MSLPTIRNMEFSFGVEFHLGDLPSMLSQKDMSPDRSHLWDKKNLTAHPLYCVCLSKDIVHTNSSWLLTNYTQVLASSHNRHGKTSVSIGWTSITLLTKNSFHLTLKTCSTQVYLPSCRNDRHCLIFSEPFSPRWSYTGWNNVHALVTYLGRLRYLSIVRT